MRGDELHQTFNFAWLTTGWSARDFAAVVNSSIASLATAEASPPTWVLSNHDVTRPVTRYGREDSSFAFLAKRFGVPTDLTRGTRRARAAALLTAGR